MHREEITCSHHRIQRSIISPSYVQIVDRKGTKHYVHSADDGAQARDEAALSYFSSATQPTPRKESKSKSQLKMQPRRANSLNTRNH